jgi:hypothetical protein
MIGEGYLDGMRIIGMYMGDYPVSGTVRLSRVKYGNGMSHHVTLDNPINVFGAVRDSVILNENEIAGVL